MKRNNLKYGINLLAIIFLLMGCKNNDTKYFADADNEGVGIFSNKGYNLLSCFIDGKPWRTINRTYSIIPTTFTSYEVRITKQVSVNLQDTLLIMWQGYYAGHDSAYNYLSLHVPIAKDFSFKDFSAMQAQRLQVDALNSYFSINDDSFNTPGLKGSGNIYFNIAHLDSIAPYAYIGNIAGLLNADFITSKITKGRFDHSLTPNQIEF